MERGVSQLFKGGTCVAVGKGALFASAAHGLPCPQFPRPWGAHLPDGPFTAAGREINSEVEEETPGGIKSGDSGYWQFRVLRYNSIGQTDIKFANENSRGAA